MNPSYRIVFYVSGHGFGHASRDIEVIHALLRQRPDAAVSVRTSAPRPLFERTLAGRIDITALACDAGVVQVDSLTPDIALTITRAREFQHRLPALAEAEAAYLRARRASLVVGDIPPLAFVAAHMAGVPAIALGNFTWDWIYEGYADASPFDFTPGIRRDYQRAHLALRLPLSGGFEGLDSITRDIPFIARHSRREPDEVRRMLSLPPRAAGKPLVLAAFGGYGVANLNTAALGALRDYTIATTDLPVVTHGIKPAPGVLYISEQQLYDRGLRYEDLVRAADVVATKPGYGIISEAIANETALLYTSRGRFVEYDVLVRDMPRYLRQQFINRDDLLAGRWRPSLEALLSQPQPPERPATDGAEIAADAILNTCRVDS